MNLTRYAFRVVTGSLFGVSAWALLGPVPTVSASAYVAALVAITTAGVVVGDVMYSFATGNID